MGERIRLVARLDGRVQGVGFRDAIVEHAREFEVAGTVRNLRADAALEIDVEGAPGEVERFLAAVTERPPSFARIDGVRRSAATPLGRRGFVRAPTA